MQMCAGRALGELHADVAHFTNGMVPMATSTPTVVTIHDMSLTLFPHYHPARRVLLSRPLVDMAARRAAAVITVSESARRDILRLYQLAPDRVHVVHEAAAPSFRRVCDPRELDRVRRLYRLDDRIILYVGTIEPRKNLQTLIDGFAARQQAGDLQHQLVCVGPYGWLSRGVARQVERLKTADRIRFTGYVPFADLPAIYSLAEMFVFPSVYEGFGLPVVEAMACGAPVITGRAAALAEVGGEAVAQVDERDAGSLGDGLVALARDRERRDALTALGIERARQFSWHRAARETLAVYRRVVRRAVDARTAAIQPVCPSLGAERTAAPHAAAAESPQP